MAYIGFGYHMTFSTKKLIYPETKAEYLLSFLTAGLLAAIIAICIDVMAYLAIGPTSVGTWYNKYWMVFFFVCVFVPLSAFILRDSLGEKPENLFLIIILSVSLLFSWSTGTGQYSWDDGIHYRNVVIWSDPDNSIEFSTTENSIAKTTRVFEDGKNIEDIYDREFEVNYFDNDVCEVTETNKTLLTAYNKIAYFPSAFMMFVGESLNLPFSVTYILAKMAIAICYSLITYFGMKKLLTGKMLYAVIALLPTAVFLASNYSYDWWVNAFILYAFASLAGIVQDKTRKINALQGLIIPLVIIIGSFPKLIYAPLAILCILIPKERFKTKRDKYIFRGILLGIPSVIVIAACIYIYMNPAVLFSIIGSGDTRGGVDVNSPAQLEYILNNPLSYASTIITFLMPPIAHDAIGNTISGMLSPGGLKEVFTHYAYLGILPKYYCAAIIFLLGFTILTDKNKNINYKRGTWIFPLLIAIMLLIAIITAMYISFTGVGSQEVHGVQGRYLIPLLFPTLIWMGGSRLALSGKQSVATNYNTIVLFVMFVLLMFSWWQMFISFIY